MKFQADLKPQAANDSVRWVRRMRRLPRQGLPGRAAGSAVVRPSVHGRTSPVHGVPNHGARAAFPRGSNAAGLKAAAFFPDQTNMDNGAPPRRPES